MSDEWRWFLDTDVQVAGFCITTLIVAFRILSRSIKDGDDALHSRINQVRDDFREYREEAKNQSTAR